MFSFRYSPLISESQINCLWKELRVPKNIWQIMRLIQIWTVWRCWHISGRLRRHQSDHWLWKADRVMLCHLWSLGHSSAHPHHWEQLRCFLQKREAERAVGREEGSLGTSKKEGSHHPVPWTERIRQYSWRLFDWQWGWEYSPWHLIESIDRVSEWWHIQHESGHERWPHSLPGQATAGHHRAGRRWGHWQAISPQKIVQQT